MKYRKKVLPLAAMIVLLAPASLYAQDDTTTDDVVTEEADAADVSDELVTPGGRTPSDDSAETGQDAVQSNEGVNYDLRLVELEDRVSELRREVASSRSRLFMLRQQLLQESVGGSRTVITHNDTTGAQFRLVQAMYSLDGNQIYSEVNDEGLSDFEEVYNGSVVAGPHNLSVRMVFEGNGFGMFSYMEGYEFIVDNSHAFSVDEGRTVMLDVEATNVGGVNAPIEERASIVFREESVGTTESVAEVSE